jgi:hypothetical protein
LSYARGDDTGSAEEIHWDLTGWRVTRAPNAARFTVTGSVVTVMTGELGHCAAATTST